MQLLFGQQVCSWRPIIIFSKLLRTLVAEQRQMRLLDASFDCRQELVVVVVALPADNFGLGVLEPTLHAARNIGRARAASSEVRS